MALRDERRNGLDGIVLESDEVSLSVFPAAGGKIMDLIHRPSGRNLLWHNPRVGLAATNPGAPFDDVWCGGWDEVFPKPTATTTTAICGSARGAPRSTARTRWCSSVPVPRCPA